MQLASSTNEEKARPALATDEKLPTDKKPTQPFFLENEESSEIDSPTDEGRTQPYLFGYEERTPTNEKETQQNSPENDRSDESEENPLRLLEINRLLSNKLATARSSMSEEVGTVGSTDGSSSKVESVLHLPVSGIADGGEYYMTLSANTHLPWMRDYQPWMTGSTLPAFDCALYDCSRLSEVTVPVKFRDIRSAYFIDLFFQKRFFRAAGTHKTQPSPAALVESWNYFVDDVDQSIEAVVANINNNKEHFCRHDVEGMKMRVHEMCMEELLPCGVLRGVACPMCYPDSKRLPSGLRLNENGRVPTSLIEAIAELDEKVTTVERNKREAEVQRSLLDDSYMESFGVTQEDFLRVATYSTNAFREVQTLKMQQADLLKKFKVLQSGGDDMHKHIQNLDDHVQWLMQEQLRQKRQKSDIQ